MAEQPGSGRLDPEILAAYVDGRLPPEDRARVEAEIAADPETQEWLVNTIRAVDDVDAVPEPRGQTSAVVLPFHRRRGIVGGVGVVLATAAALFLVVRVQPAWWQQLWGPAADPRFAKLVAAVGEERYIEGRLTGGFKYGPLRSVTRGPGDLSNQNLALLAAAGELQKAVQEDPSAENLHAWGVAQVLLGDYDEAVRTLQRLADDGGSSEVHTDLAAALLARADVHGRAVDLPNALDHAEKALLADPANLAALYTRALLLDRLFLVDQAMAAWEAYLERDSSTGWAASARQHLEALSKRSDRARWEDLKAGLLDMDPRDTVAALSAARSFPQYVRELVEDELLPSWGRLVLERDPDAPAAIQRASTIATALAAAGGDRLALLTIQDLALAAPSRIAEVARGLRSFGEGRALFEMEQMSDAFDPLHDAVRRLAASGSPMANAARISAAQTDYFRGDLTALAAGCEIASRELDQLTGVAAHRGRARWGRALASAVAGDFATAAPLYQSALGDFQSVGERENQANIHALLSETYGFLGDPVQAWGEQLRALREMPAMRTARRRQAVLIGAAVHAEQSGQLLSAVAFLTTAETYAAATARPATTAEILARRGALFARSRNFAAARRDLRAARAQLTKVHQPGLSTRLEAEILAGDLLASVDSLGPVDSAEGAVATFQSQRMVARTPELWLSLARLRQSRNELEGAVEALTSGFNVASSALSNGGRNWRATGTEQAEILAAEAAYLLSQLGRPREALGFVLSARRSRPLRQGDSGQLADFGADAILAIAVSSDRLTTMLAHRGIVKSETRVVPVPRVAASSDACRRSVESAASDSTACASLFELLVDPYKRSLVDIEVLFVSMPSSMSGLPLSALRERATGRHLASMVQVAVLASTDRAFSSLRIMAPRIESVAAAGDPTLDGLEVGLEPLPGARREAEQIANLYPRGRALVGERATKVAIIESLGNTDVFHFSGHSVWNESYPGLSRLVVSGTGSDSSLYAFEVLALSGKGRVPRVVVLASCRSSGSVQGESAGTPGLPGAFVRIGVESVVASTIDWPDNSSNLMVELHRRLLNGQNPIAAVSEIQRSSLDVRSLALQVYV